MSLYLVYPSVADHLSEALGVPVFVGDPPKDLPTPFLFVWGAIPVENDLPLSTVDETLNVQVVGKAVPEVNTLASRVIDTVQGFKPTVPGFDCQPLHVTHTTSASTDQQVTDPTTDLRPAWLTVCARYRANRKREP